MKDNNIEAAVKAAQEFISRVISERNARSTFEVGGNLYPTSSPAHTGALRRQSMELTRALSKMRNDR